ncbi:MAG: hypothetical protein ACD_20C00176G0007 [uncultured bacterium]|nr:MAG: hypothetical protein ACD_20C00176G0007 [uncultured bacterium]HBH17422.1 peptidase S41 [Cyanobacteria bacterium UBA9579]
MPNKKNPIFLIILIIILSLSLNACSFTTHQQAKQGDNFFFIADGFGKAPQDIFLQAWKAIKDEHLDKTYNHQDWSRWKTRYFHQIKTKEDAYLAIDTMIESLDDPYTRFLKPYDFQEQNRSIDAELFGIGVHITKAKDQVTIIDVIDGTPAKKAGLQPGDMIVRIDNKSTKGLEIKDVAEKVRGKVGSKVTIGILRDKKELTKEITRERIEIKSVDYKILNNNYAYIKISSFISSETSFEMLNALDATKNAKGIIIDLRGNQGGLLPNAIFIANMFINKGDIVSIVDRNGRKKIIKAESDISITNKPVVILVNQASASASEILSGALKDHKRAILVGETTYGKGMVQKIHKLADGSGINITIGKYLTPDGTDINKKGISPDYTVKLSEEDFLKDKDPQLDKAKQLLAGKIAAIEKLTAGK